MQGILFQKAENKDAREKSSIRKGPARVLAELGARWYLKQLEEPAFAPDLGREP